MPRLEVRAPTLDEMLAVRELRLEELYKPLGLTTPYESDALVDAAQDTIHMAGLEDDRVVSTLRVENHPSFGHYVNLMVTARDRRRQGLGRKVHDAAEMLVRDAGASCLTLHAEPEAMGFYENLGYRETGSLAVGIIGQVVILCPKMKKELA
ncbi:MAG TPA: GNAT family N-acetyltransferase [Verrucomicrobiae bacterium]|jgi:GNAT superfamily N-acetyltransferase|nr:GNAT family N-acetyltransferase [Verrucomicrobiae bacterium]